MLCMAKIKFYNISCNGTDNVLKAEKYNKESSQDLVRF